MQYNYLDLFHGIGGFALGAYWAGMKFENHLCSDIEKYPIELYKKRFPDSIQLGDITKINWEKLKKDYPGEWIITGGFPCQDISQAGKGRGLIDEETGKKTRSGLWFDYWTAIRILQPRFVIIENVRALLNRGLTTVLANLAEIGYNAEWQIISAEDMGAPHKRERVWIVAYSHNNGSLQQNEKTILRRRNIINKRSENSNTIERCCENDLANSELCGCLHGQIEKQSTETWKSTQCNTCAESEMANSDNERLQRRKESGNVESKRQKTKQFIKRHGKSSRGDYWSVEPDMGRLVNGLPGRVDRLKGLGNAIVPQIAELLFNQIKGYLYEK
jgi:DNA (cytosine-5)-methyltransferase 1